MCFSHICALLIEMCNLMYSNVNVFQLTSFDFDFELNLKVCVVGVDTPDRRTESTHRIICVGTPEPRTESTHLSQ